MKTASALSILSVLVSTAFSAPLARVKGTPYKPYFRPDLFVYPEMTVPGRTPIDCDTQAMNLDFFGLDETKFDEVGIVASACGEIYIPQNSPVKAVDMIHLFYKTDNGLELRSRYYLGNNIQVEIPVLGSLLPVNTIANLLGLNNLAVGAELSYSQFHHDQQEMTHLASILPEVYAAFGPSSDLK
ncbi:uncharacterized protein FA14DRAFT_154929 [Meira miltonrushii]|uniref:DAPG hydrolase PhiG domain-containing protein n=1 Tax=Meira miltonrushii TaxID=1280837 RepID=A0A316VD89_9BASI|nr:uncharacterized protein FA14DRAFT_154929 [Meira miltonrushii]PWN35516.1 hypothetical protein FA14DRAFT_154929 [Meira miltonrushii]